MPLTYYGRVGLFDLTRTVDISDTIKGSKGSIGMILSKYAIPSLTVSVTDIKNLMWRHFVDVSYLSLIHI